jgi:predicted Zn-dependent peptidase
MKILPLYAVILLLLFSCKSQKEETKPTFSVPVEYFKLDNGLKVVLSKDTTAPVVTVAVYYNIGFRIEPRDRTGFAHLFEHMMFQGSENLPKGSFDTLITNNGGVNNGSTRFDYTNYYEVVPSHILEPVLWAEADRMKNLAITKENLVNQQGVVVNEINGALFNQPYGGFPWLDMPQYANTNWYNAHNFYGDIKDVEAANVDEVKNFFNTYYAPNNAVLVITGDFDSATVAGWVRKYFGPIASVEQAPKPDLTEPAQEEEKKFSKEDKLAKQPALAFAYHMPERNSPEYYAMGLLDQILLQGENSRLFTVLVKQRGLTGSVDGGINLLGNMFDYNGPMLWTVEMFHDNDVSSDSIMQVVDSVINDVIDRPVSNDDIDKAVTKFLSGFYNNLSGITSAGRANLLASFALFDDNPSMINSIEKNLRSVTPELIQKTADQYLRKTNRTVLTIVPLANK